MPAVKATEAMATATEMLATRVTGTDSKVLAKVSGFMGTATRVLASFTGVAVTVPGVEAKATGDMGTATKDVARATGHHGGNWDIPVLAETKYVIY